MAGGWTRDGAVQDQIDDTVKDAIARPCADALRRQRRRMRRLRGGNPEETARSASGRPHLRRLPVGARQACRSLGINRRGSKDSQLR